MPKELLMECVNQLQEVVSKLESYAEEMGEEDSSEDSVETVSDAEMPNSSYGNESSGKGAKIKMAAAAIRRGLSKKY